MISFCDIPLSNIKDHTSKYGYYSIGLTKNWARKNGLNPVLYFERSSNLLHSTLLVLSTELFELKKSNATDPDKHPLTEIFRYSKNNVGTLIRKGIVKKENYKFSDEREWRYCPTKIELNGSPFIISNNYTDYTKVKDKHNKEISSLRLDFEPSDISYIIIKKESEIPELINHLEHNKGKQYAYQDIRRLTTRIITSDQIINDF